MAAGSRQHHTAKRAPPPRDLQHWRRHLERHAALATTRDEPEDVHQVRVAARRLRTVLELQGRRALVDDLIALGRALGPARDLHLLEGCGPLTAWAQEQAGLARAATLAALGSPRTRGLLQALRHLPSAPGPGAARELERREAAVRKALRRRARAEPAERPRATHRLRRQVRRLRYAREALGLDAAALAELQASLGAYCDVLALERLVARWGEELNVDVRGALRLLDRALTAAASAPPPPPGSPARRRARSRGGRRAPSPSAS